MRKPDARTHLLGHPVSLLVTFGGGGLLMYQWYIGTVDSDWAPVLAVLIMAVSAGAHQRLAAYGRWKRAWDAMGGAAQTRSVRSRKSPLLQAMAWIVLAGTLLSCLDYQDPGNVWVAIGIVAVTLVVLTAAYLQHRFSQRGKRRKDFAVAIVLSVPHRSPGERQFARGLPDYCKRLL